MDSRKLICSSLLFMCTLITISMGHCTSHSISKDTITLAYLKRIEELIANIKENMHCGKSESEKKPVDCYDVQQYGHTKSGVYSIWPKNSSINQSVEVYCDMDTDGGGWTVIQRRGNFGQPVDYFYRDWESYKWGFGSNREDFWLGNELISDITNKTEYSIRFDLGDFNGNKRYAVYDNFSMGGSDDQYPLHISLYRGDAGDAMAYHDKMLFSTKDRDNDRRPGTSCAQDFQGAWWYNGCYYANLNGLYLQNTSYQAVIWYNWKYGESLMTTEMKIRPRYSHTT